MESARSNLKSLCYCIDKYKKNIYTVRLSKKYTLSMFKIGS